MSGMDWAGFFSRNGYGVYIWGSIGMCALVVLGECLVLRQQMRRLKQQVQREGSFDAAAGSQP